jgi:aminopeptidase N
MSSSATRPNLLPIAAFVSLLVLLLGATGLFALHHTHQKITAGLRELDATEQRTLLALRTRAAFKTQVQEWKNILLRGRNPEDLAAYRARFEKEETLVRDGLTRLAAPKLPATDAKDLVAEHARLGEAYRAALAIYSASPSDPESSFKADAAVRGLDRPLAEELDALASAEEKTALDELAAMSTRAAARYEALRRITWIVASFAVLAAFWLCFRATRTA